MNVRTDLFGPDLLQFENLIVCSFAQHSNRSTKSGSCRMSDTKDRLVQFVDGFPLPSEGFIPEVFRKVLRLPVKSGDVILSTYPKCGTTWTQYIIWGLLNGGKEPPSVNQLMFRDFPFGELVGPEAFLALPDPRLIKFHLPYEMTPKCKGCRLVHVLRNPFDACVSMWHHLLEIDAAIAKVDLPFDDFFETFMRGTCMFGDYFQHEMSWYAKRKDPDVLFLTFEYMKKDPSGAVTTVADFLGLGEAVRKDSGRLLEDVLRHSTFSHLKDNCRFQIARDEAALARMGADYTKMAMDKEATKDETLFRTVNFFRKGQVGGSREKLSADQWSCLEKAIQERVPDPELRKLMMDVK